MTGSDYPFRFLKLLVVAWVVSFAFGYGFFSALGAGLPWAFVTWLIIRNRPAEAFKIISKPTFGMLILVGAAGVGNLIGPLRDSGMTASNALFQAHLSLPGFIILLGIGGLFLAPGYKVQQVQNAQD